MTKLARPERPAFGKARVVAALVLSLLLFLWPQPSARAQCINCPCSHIQWMRTWVIIAEQHALTQAHIATQFELHRTLFWEKFYFGQNILAALRGMTEQLVTTGMLQIEAVGAMMDAQNQIETQQLMQQMVARAHKKYRPDMEMCTLGSASRNLGPAYRNGELAREVLNKRMQDRVFGNGQSVGGGGKAIDKAARFAQLRTTYCDAQDHFNDMAGICNNPPAASVNRDISYMETVGQPQTINATLTDGAVNGDDPHIFAMAANLYGNDTFNFFQQQAFRDPANHPAYLDVREVAARRNVAEYSFDSLVGMKVAGSAQGRSAGDFAAQVYRQLGFPQEQARRMVGDSPSYNAVMELMNKVVYLRPEFYINLYTSPANVERIGATIHAANLMQDMDEFKGQLRSEMNLSQILEFEVARIQDGIQSRIYPMQSKGVTQIAPTP